MGLVNSYFEMLVDWPLGTVLSVLVAFCLGTILFLGAWGLFVAYDSWYLPHEENTGVIVDKEFTPTHTTMILMYNAATKTSLPQPIVHPDKWSVTVELLGKRSSISISQESYEGFLIQDNVLVKYVKGRVSDDLYLKSILKL